MAYALQLLSSTHNRFVYAPPDCKPIGTEREHPEALRPFLWHQHFFAIRHSRHLCTGCLARENPFVGDGLVSVPRENRCDLIYVDIQTSPAIVNLAFYKEFKAQVALTDVAPRPETATI